jgi:hypothetical protein
MKYQQFFLTTIALFVLAFYAHSAQIPLLNHQAFVHTYEAF